MRTAPADTSRSIDPHFTERLALYFGRSRAGGRRWRTIRRLLAIALLVAAGAVATMAPRTSDAEPMVLAVTRDLPVGAVLAATDIAPRPVRDAPDGVLAASAGTAAVGRTLSGPMRRGELLTDARLVGRRGPDPGPGRAAVPIPLDDAAIADMIRPGMHVVLVGVSGQARAGIVGDDPQAADPEVGVRVLARDAVVLALSPAASGMLSGGRAGTLLAAVPDAEANAVTGAAADGAVTVRFVS